jgi:hypothetical protein
MRCGTCSMVRAQRTDAQGLHFGTDGPLQFVCERRVLAPGPRPVGEALGPGLQSGR